MSADRRFALLKHTHDFDADANAAIDARVTKSFVDALNVDADTIDGLNSSAFAQLSQQNIFTNAGAAIRMRGNHADNTNVVYIPFELSDGTRVGYIGDGSTGSNNINIVADLQDIVLQATLGSIGLNPLVGSVNLNGPTNVNGTLTIESPNDFVIENGGNLTHHITAEVVNANSSDGYFRIASCDSAQGRSGCEIWVSSGGGSGIPAPLHLSVVKDWNTKAPQVTVLGYMPGHITDIRPGYDSTTGDAYIDIKVAHSIDASYTVKVVGFGFSGNGWVANATTSPVPATPDTTYNISLSANNLIFGAFSYGGASVEVPDTGGLVISSPDDDAVLYLRADTTNTVESANPYIHLQQDGTAVTGIIGLTGVNNVDAAGNAFSGISQNGLAIHHSSGNGSLGIGVGGTVGLLLDTNNIATFSGVIRGPDGSQTAPAFAFSADTNTGLYRVGTDAVGFVAGSIRMFDVSSTHTTFRSPVYVQEKAAAQSDFAGFGQLWVKNTSPCQLWFTDDSGNDGQIPTMIVSTAAASGASPDGKIWLQV